MTKNTPFQEWESVCTIMESTSKSAAIRGLEELKERGGIKDRKELGNTVLEKVVKVMSQYIALRNYDNTPTVEDIREYLERRIGSLFLENKSEGLMRIYARLESCIARLPVNETQGAFLIFDDYTSKKVVRTPLGYYIDDEGNTWSPLMTRENAKRIFPAIGENAITNVYRDIALLEKDGTLGNIQNAQYLGRPHDPDSKNKDRIVHPIAAQLLCLGKIHGNCDEYLRKHYESKGIIPIPVDPDETDAKKMDPNKGLYQYQGKAWVRLSRYAYDRGIPSEDKLFNALRHRPDILFRSCIKREGLPVWEYPGSLGRGHDSLIDPILADQYISENPKYQDVVKSEIARKYGSGPQESIAPLGSDIEDIR